MEVRKLIRMGKSSSVVSLPKKWIDNARLKAGSNIYIDFSQAGELILKPENSSKETKAVTLSIEPKIEESYLRRMIISKYLGGFEKISIESKEIITPELREEISKVSSSLIGLEVVEEGMKRISIECLVKPGELPIDKLIRRMYLLTKDMHKDALEILFRRDKALARTVIERDTTVNRLHYLSMRYLSLATMPGENSGIEISANDCLHYQSLTKYLERIADHAKNIAKYFGRVSSGRVTKKLLEKIKNINIEINKLFDDVMMAFFKNDAMMANSVIDEVEEIRDKLKEIVQEVLKLKSETALNVALALESTLRIAEYTGDIAEVVIDRAA